MINVMTLPKPEAGRASKIAKHIKNGRYTSAKIEALALFTKPLGPLRSKPIKIKPSAIAAPTASARIPPNQVAADKPMVLIKSDLYET